MGEVNLFFNLSEEVLQGVAAGIDLFDSEYVVLSAAYHFLNMFLCASNLARFGLFTRIFCRYIYHLTLGGIALTFPPCGVEINASEFHPSYLGNEQTKINLRATIYRYW